MGFKFKDLLQINNNFEKKYVIDVLINEHMAEP